jgi:rhamnosyltransferase
LVPHQASVIIRAKDKADTIGLTLRALRGQTRAVEIVVVDSGSTDGTLEIARSWADRVVEIPAESFSYGRALNIGAAVSSGSVHFALSAHCVPKRADWVEHSLSLYDDDRIAATNQARVTPRGEPILDRYIQTRDDALRHPGWGFSNHAASWRADVWAALPFREDLPACEDKEWSWRVLAAGWGIAYCPQLEVPSTHRRKQGIKVLHRRVAREAQAMVSLGAARPLTAWEAVRLGWSHFSPMSRYPNVLRRLSPYRVVQLSGAVVGGRRVGCGAAAPGADLFADQSPGGQRGRPAYNPLW